MRSAIKIIFLLGILISNAQAMSFGRAQFIYKNLVMSQDTGYSPRLQLSNSTKVNASAYYGVITINIGMLRFLNNDDELALILAHELAHFKLGHRFSSPSNEYAADSLGARYVQKIGYNVCNGAQLLKRLKGGPSKTHPDSINRYNRLCS